MKRPPFKWLRKHGALNWALLDQGMVSASNFLCGILLARYLGIEEFGRFTLAWLGVEFFLALQNAAIIAPMMTLGPKQALSEEREYYGAVMVQQICIAVLLSLLIFVGAAAAAPMVPDWDLESLAMPLGFVLLASQLQSFLRRYFFTRMRGMTAFSCDMIRYPGQALALLLLVQVQSLDTVDALWVIVALSALSSVFAAFGIDRVALARGSLIATTRRHWLFSKWLISSEVLRLITQNLLTIVAGFLLGAAAVGALRAAQQVLGLINVLQFGLDNIAPIRAAKLFHQYGREGLITYLLRFALAGGLAVGTIAALVVVAPEFWLSIFYGGEFLGHGYLVQWWAAVYMVSFFSLPGTYGLRALEQTRYIFIAQVCVAVIALVSAYPLIQHLGLVGVMIGRVLLHCVRTTMLAAVCARFLRRVPARSGKD